MNARGWKDSCYAMELAEVAGILGMCPESVWRTQRKVIRRLWRNWRRYGRV